MRCCVRRHSFWIKSETRRSPWVPPWLPLPPTAPQVLLLPCGHCLRKLLFHSHCSNSVQPRAASPQAAPFKPRTLRVATVGCLHRSPLGHSHFRPSRAPRRFQGWAQMPREDSLPSDLHPPPCLLWATPACPVGCNGTVPPHLLDLRSLLPGSAQSLPPFSLLPRLRLRLRGGLLWRSPH